MSRNCKSAATCNLRKGMAFVKVPVDLKISEKDRVEIEELH